jgi:hypothetical protein
MKIIVYLQTVALLASLGFANSGFAQVYKCTAIDANSQQAKVAYSDMPCDKTAKQSATDITELAKNSVKNQTVKYTSAELDNAVTQAVLNKNFVLAKSLAKTKEHWRLIAITESASQTAPMAARDQANNVAQSSADNACERAQQDYDSTYRLYWRDKELIAAKKSVMFATCGVPENEIYAEPVIYRPVIVVQPYARPYHAHKGHNYDQNYGADSYYNPAQAYHRPLPMVNRSTGLQASASIGFRSKNFNVQATSFEEQSTHHRGYQPYSW